MMNLRRTVNILLRLPDPHERSVEITHRCLNIPSPDVAGLRYIASDIPKPSANVVESSAVIVPSKRPPEKPDPRVPLSCFQPFDGAGGLELCTESLGFESCCDGRMGEVAERAEEQIRRLIEENGTSSTSRASRKKTIRSSRRAEAKKFPPPLPWLMNSIPGGAFMRSVRKDGRLMLTEVRIDQPEILLAFRQDGRLRLQFFKSPKVEEEEREKAVVVDQGEEVGEEAVQEEAGEKMKGGGGGVGEEEERVRLWQAAMKRSKGRRGTCQSAVTSSFWNYQRFVTTA